MSGAESHCPSFLLPCHPSLRMCGRALYDAPVAPCPGSPAGSHRRRQDAVKASTTTTTTSVHGSSPSASPAFDSPVVETNAIKIICQNRGTLIAPICWSPITAVAFCVSQSMSPASIITLLAACFTVAVQGYKLSRLERQACPVNAAMLLNECLFKYQQLSQMEFRPEMCGMARESLRCANRLVLACFGSSDPDFLKVLGSYDLTGGRLVELCRSVP